MSPLEFSASLVYGLSVFLAARNSAHTWWLGIVGCTLYGFVFYYSRLYADVSLQLFFIVTSLMGWFYWLKGNLGTTAIIRRSSGSEILIFFALALASAAGYGSLLYYFTDAYAPFFDSAILTFSILAQFLLMRRRVETWVFWLIVNTIAIPLYASRDLYITSFLYAIFWFNAWHGFFQWHRVLKNETV